MFLPPSGPRYLAGWLEPAKSALSTNGCRSRRVKRHPCSESFSRALPNCHVHREATHRALLLRAEAAGGCVLGCWQSRLEEIHEAYAKLTRRDHP